MATLVPLGQMEPRKAGERMAGSYVNFYMANEAVIVPQFDVPQVRVLFHSSHNSLLARVDTPVDQDETKSIPRHPHPL